MADRRQVGVRYCGGCNSRYDRVAVVERLKRFFPGADFVPARDGTAYPAVLVVCGCASRCADVSGLLAPVGGLIAVNGFEDLLPAREQLTQALREQEERTLDHRQVLAVLPHRPPMLFIDTVSRLIPGVEVMATFLVEPDLPAFAGHFPGQPVFPGVYAVEAAAQAADILMMTTRRYEGKLPLFAEIKQARFRRKILPGDVMDIHASLLRERAEVGMATCLGQVFVQGELAVDAEIVLAFRSTKT